MKKNDNELSRKTMQQLNVYQSKYEKYQSEEVANYKGKDSSLEDIITHLKKIIQEQENKIFKFELLLKNRKINEDQIKTQYELQQQYSQKLKEKIRSFQEKEQYYLNLENEVHDLKKQIAKLRKDLSKNSTITRNTTNTRQSDMSKQDFKQIQYFQREIGAMRQQLISKEYRFNKQLQIKQKKLKKNVEITFNILNACEDMFNNCQQMENKLIKQIQMLRRKLEYEEIY